MDFVVVILGFQCIDSLLPIGCQDVTRRTGETLIDLSFQVSLVIGTLDRSRQKGEKHETMTIYLRGLETTYVCPCSGVELLDWGVALSGQLRR